MKKFLLLILTLVLSVNIVSAKPALKTLSKSGTIPKSIVPREMTALEIRAIQSRDFSVGDKLLVMKAMLDILQDCGYIVETANPVLGFISGNKDVQSENGLVISYQLTANITKMGKSTKVNIRQINRNIYGAADTVYHIYEPETYQSLYYQIDKAIFNQKAVYSKK